MQFLTAFWQVCVRTWDCSPRTPFQFPYFLPPFFPFFPLFLPSIPPPLFLFSWCYFVAQLSLKLKLSPPHCPIPYTLENKCAVCHPIFQFILEKNEHLMFRIVPWAKISINSSWLSDAFNSCITLRVNYSPCFLSRDQLPFLHSYVPHEQYWFLMS